MQLIMLLHGLFPAPPSQAILLPLDPVLSTPIPAHFSSPIVHFSKILTTVPFMEVVPFLWHIKVAPIPLMGVHFTITAVLTMGPRLRVRQQVMAPEAELLILGTTIPIILSLTAHLLKTM